MKKLLLIGTTVLLMTASAHAQSTCPQCMGDGFPHPNFQQPVSAQHNVRPINISPTMRSSGHGACDSLCQTKCQGAWRALGFRSVNACVARWAKLNAEGTAAACETAIKANGMRPIRGC